MANRQSDPALKTPGYKAAPHKWGFTAAEGGWEARFIGRCSVERRFIAVTKVATGIQPSGQG
jgi:hypothetical protein